MILDENGFAAACYDQNSIAGLEAALNAPVDPAQTQTPGTAGRRARMNSFTVLPFYAGRSAAWRGETLDDIPDYYTDQQADEWVRGWYSIRDDERAEAMERAGR